MGFLSFFIKRRKSPARKRKPLMRGAIKIDEIIRKNHTSFLHLKKNIAEINITLNRHDNVLTEHGRLLDDHGAKFVSLEQRLLACAPAPPQKELPLLARPVQAIGLSAAAALPPYQTTRQHNIENFSPQEKRILSIFFQNHAMAFSYIDIAKVLGKSANTVKNQMHQLSMKADLFERSIDNQNRNRFKLKDGLKVEQYLNVN